MAGPEQSSESSHTDPHIREVSRVWPGELAPPGIETLTMRHEFWQVACAEAPQVLADLEACAMKAFADLRNRPTVTVDLRTWRASTPFDDYPRIRAFRAALLAWACEYGLEPNRFTRIALRRGFTEDWVLDEALECLKHWLSDEEARKRHTHMGPFYVYSGILEEDLSVSIDIREHWEPVHEDRKGFEERLMQHIHSQVQQRLDEVEAEVRSAGAEPAQALKTHRRDMWMFARSHVLNESVNEIAYALYGPDEQPNDESLKKAIYRKADAIGLTLGFDTTQSAYERIRRLSKRALLGKGKGLHALRHYRGTRIAAELGLGAAQQHLRRSNMATTQVYAKWKDRLPIKEAVGSW